MDLTNVYKKESSFFKAVTLLFRIENDKDDWVYTEEPHVLRRQEILKKYPQIKELMGPDSSIVYYATVEIIIQMTVAILISIYQPNWIIWFLLSYIIGGTLNHSLGCVLHETGHNLVFGHKYGTWNRIFSIYANLPLAIPIAISYKKYHQDHHRWLGHSDYDSDVPTKTEVKLFRHPLGRIIWLCIYPIFYAIRPFIKTPRPITYWELINFVVQITFDLLVLHYLGAHALGYLLFGTWFGLGPHPMAGHFISEHYLFADNQATHSYYGLLNFLMVNVGYHVEHHDFPYVARTRLPELRKIAAEFYDPLPFHTSLCKVIWDFVFHPNLGPHAHSVTLENRSRPEIYTNPLLADTKDKIN